MLFRVTNRYFAFPIKSLPQSFTTSPPIDTTHGNQRDTTYHSPLHRVPQSSPCLDEFQVPACQTLMLKSAKPAMVVFARTYPYPYPGAVDHPYHQQRLLAPVQSGCCRSGL